jgi:hypothetical protein
MVYVVDCGIIIGVIDGSVVRIINHRITRFATARAISTQHKALIAVTGKASRCVGADLLAPTIVGDAFIDVTAFGLARHEAVA